MANRLRELDPARFVTGAISGFLAMTDCLDELKAVMETAEQEAESIGEHEKTGGGSEALNAAMSKMEQHKKDVFSTNPHLSRAMEEVACELDVVGYNYLTARHEQEHILHPERVVVGSETYPTEIARLWDIVEHNHHVIGDFTWTGYDYLGEAGIAGYHYTPERHEQGWYPDRLAYCGDINLNGYRRPVSYLRECTYGLRREPFIAVERVDKYGMPDNTNDWKYADAIDSWTFDGYEGKETAVHVLSASDEVELFLNGRSLGRKPAGKKAGFDVAYVLPYEPGELRAVGCTGDAEDGCFVLRTAGRPAKLSVQVSRDTLDADGRSLALITADLADENGIINHWTPKDITVRVQGAGVLEGFGSADPSCEGSYQQDTWTTFDGRVMAAVRSGFEKGEIRVKISCPGCEDVQLTLQVR